MRGTGLVVSVVRPVHRDRPFIPEHRAQRHHIGLLDGLRPADPLGAEAHVKRHLGAPVSGRVDVFELEIAGKLLEDPGGWIETGHQALSQRAPAPRLGLVDGQSR